MSLDHHWTDELWRSPYRLRFELSTGGSYVNMFSSSYDRVRQLARAALPTGSPLAVIADYPSPFWGRSRREPEPNSTTGFDLLEAMGVSTKEVEASWEGYFYPGDEDDKEAAPREHRAVRLTWDEADILLWNNIAQEIGVEPRAPVLSKLVDREKGVVVNAYDDRGMDIVGLSSDPILDLYRRFDRWLLDYDRPRMAEVFGPRASS